MYQSSTPFETMHEAVDSYLNRKVEGTGSWSWCSSVQQVREKHNKELYDLVNSLGLSS